ncbi:MAG: dihydrofolate reductase [Gammaproteobacteria bacterium]|jgi:dihydrofolate reductase|nr:dihydrofolate reductase [Gammaproteobacteria bacterium]
MSLALIVAASENNVIGRHNQLPWYLPGDLAYFKAITMAKPVIMGRKTYESIGKPLPGRDNIVITRNADYPTNGIKVVASLQAAIEVAQSLLLVNGGKEIMVIGGAQIYKQALSMAERVYLTRVHRHVEGDAFFPELAPAQWQEVAREDIAAAEPNPFDFSYLVLDRVNAK